MKTFKKLAATALAFGVTTAIVGAACLMTGAPVWLAVAIVAVYWVVI